MLKKLIHGVVFSSKWVLVIFYAGLVLAQCLYFVNFCQEVYHLSFDFLHITENQFMLVVLTLVDITMIANLLKMIIAGSYQSFVEKVETSGVSHISSGLMKVKMGSSLIGVSSIHLLQVFLNPENISTREVYVKCAIHSLFLIGTLALAGVYYLSIKTENIEQDDQNHHKL